MQFTHQLYSEALIPHVQVPPLMLCNESFKVSSDNKCVALEDGLVVLKQCLDMKTQKWLAGVVMQRGIEPPARGFWQKSADGAKQPNSSPSAGRGRIFDSIEAFPSEFGTVCAAVLEAAQEADMTLPCMKPTHVRLLHYSGGLGVKPKIHWHKDEDANDGRKDRPIISLSLGQTCLLMLSHAHPHEQTGQVHKVSLESGDAYLMGGRCRHIYHTVQRVLPGTCPPELLGEVGEARLVVSFHDAPGVDATEYASLYTPGLQREGWDPLWREQGVDTKKS